MLFPLAFRFLYPINVQQTSEVAIETAGMDIFPSEQLQRGVFEFNEQDPPNPRLLMLGYESESFALNSGTSLIFFIMQLFFLGTYLLLRPAKNRFCRQARWPNKIRRKIRLTLIWNGLIDFFYGAHVEL